MQTLHFNDPKLVMSLSSIENLAELTRYLKNKPRQMILQALEKQGGMTVSDLYTSLGWEQSYCSQMLSSLKKAGLILAEREGHFITYTINKPLLLALKKCMVEIYEN